ncbi:hypothetical protein BLNAU_23640 [Blattamonas nauphoetae]|uniref:Uncharacterized protein n=1 Tax=Blattamonas nauphoetae TaxID=2049346 RepID=A0ABQ9WPM2_9EUKA|nr:hypothetical protein BLNAU_23640 [Blattamonas nauphoetae]
MRGIDDCSQFARSLFAVSIPSLRRRADEADRMPRTELENILALVRCSPRLVCAAPSAPILRRFEPTLSADESVASVSLIHTIQRTAAGRKSSEQFAEHGELSSTRRSSPALLQRQERHRAGLLLLQRRPPLSSPRSTRSRRLSSLTTLFSPDLLRGETQSSVPLVSFSRIESTLSHPISFPKTHRVIVSLDSLIPLFASNQIFPSLDRTSLVPLPKPDQPLQPLRHNEGQLRCVEPSLQGVPPPCPHSPSPFSPSPRRKPHSPASPSCTFLLHLPMREAVKMEMSVMIKRMSQYAEKTRSRGEVERACELSSQDRHSRHWEGRVSRFRSHTCLALSPPQHCHQAGSRDRPTASATYRRGGQVECDQNVGRCGLRRDGVQRRASVVVHPFVPRQHTRFARKPDHTHKEETTENATDEGSTLLPVQRDGRSQVRVATPQTDTHPSPSVSTQATHSTSSQHAENVPDSPRDQSQRALDISSPSLLAASLHLHPRRRSLSKTHPPFSDSVPSEAEEGQATDLTTQLQDEEDGENFDAMDEFRQFSLQKSFGGRGSEWGGASNGGRGGHLTNLFACFPLHPSHADAQKTNDMAFPPSTRLKMHKEVNLVSAAVRVHDHRPPSEGRHGHLRRHNPIRSVSPLRSSPYHLRCLLLSLRRALVYSVLTSARLSIHPLTSLNQIARSRSVWNSRSKIIVLFVTRLAREKETNMTIYSR